MSEISPFVLPRSEHNETAYSVAKYAALEAGKILKKRYGLNNRVQVKGLRNLVTEADLMAEKCILGIIKAGFPGHGIVSEEAGTSHTEREYVWIIDPLDGTNNFHFGIPFFCVNIALVRQGEVVMGLTYDPMRNELFHAVKGRGAFINNKKTAVSGVSRLAQASVGMDLGYVPERSVEMLDMTAEVWKKAHCVRLMGSSCLGLAYAASGRLSLYIHKYLYPWDVASGLLLIRESGGEAINFEGRPATVDDRTVIASNKKLLAEFGGWLKLR